MNPAFRPENTACLVVDIQTRLCPALHQAEAMTANSLTLLQGLTALNVPVMITEQYPKGLGNTVPEIAELLPAAPVAEKTRFSALTDETEHFLLGKQHVILIGAESHVCMLQTVLDLRERGFHVWIPFECTTSRNPANRDNALTHMRQAGAVVSNVESILFLLLQDAKHPAFKTVSGLIR
ncbi:isochorismatase family protein [Neisseria leonii]|uniref:isochorismatase family protein n=1 Tax=Neisseria leonii TaxID=2995413 RepID=UPI0030D29C48